MNKYLLWKLTPNFLINFYKKKQFYKIIKDFDIEKEPDLIVAQKIVDANSVVLDIGANIGIYTSFLATCAEKVIALEPVPFTFKVLTTNILKLGLQNVELHQLAISDKNGQASIVIPSQAGTRNYYRASLVKYEDKTASKFSLTVTTKSLDSLFLNYPNKISLIKCDVEGHELNVVKGAEKFLKNSKSAWLIEISEDIDDQESSAFKLNEIMEKHDYHNYVYENKILRKRRKGDKSINYFYLQDFHIEKLRQTSITVA